ncbi:hypothetical protein ARMGADRAFT_1093420 [Armillaria gallica]|uniref:Uncharacterized protein n=1 Tax=Armillaria gallica TaxID=47427 RepID=A0A2H3CB61_ARMGA|nr:hypothetical protein ARMGADRAFT_1093420 [Armillaria gallica]
MAQTSTSFVAFMSCPSLGASFVLFISLVNIGHDVGLEKLPISLTTMSPDVQVYLKPRPISSVFGHSKYLPFQWNPDFKCGPFFAGYGTIPADATEVYTIHSPHLSAGIAAFHNELIPSLQDEPLDPDNPYGLTSMNL